MFLPRTYHVFTGIALLMSLGMVDASASVLFSDDFGIGASPLWGNDGGNWVASSGHYSTTTGGFSLSTLPIDPGNNFTIEVDVNNAWDGGIFFYSESPFSGITLIIAGEGGGGRGLYWHTWQNGSHSAILNHSGTLFPSGADIHVKITVIDNVFSAYLNGSETPATVFSSDLFSSGNITLFSNTGGSQNFDNFVLSQNTIGLDLKPESLFFLVIGLALMGIAKIRFGNVNG